MKKIIKTIAFSFAFMFLAQVGSVHAAAPVITSLSPNSSSTGTGTVVTITGTGFTETNNTINFDGYSVDIAPSVFVSTETTSTGEVITIRKMSFTVPKVTIPQCFTTPCNANFPVVVVNNNGTSNTMQFTVGDNSTTCPPNTYWNGSKCVQTTIPLPNTPFIKSITPSSGVIGSTVTITGTGFTANNKIKFGSLGTENNPAYNLPAYPVNTYSTSSDNLYAITFTVPASNYMSCWTASFSCGSPAVKTATGIYDISVINENGTSNNVKFTVGEPSTTCPPNTYWNGTSCATLTIPLPENCPSNTYWNGSSCVQNIIYCPTGYIGTYPNCVIKTYSPEITSLSHSSGPVGTNLIIKGRNFSTRNNQVMFGNSILNLPATFSNTVNNSGTVLNTEYSISLIVPKMLPNINCVQAPCYSSYSISVSTPSGKSNEVKFTITDGIITTDKHNDIKECNATKFTRALRYGSRNSQVDALQTILVDKGYLNEDYATGLFSSRTRTALKSLQTANGLRGDGIPGPFTRALLNNLWKTQCLADQDDSTN